MTEIKKQEGNKVFFDLTVSAEAMKKAEMDVYKKNKQYFHIPGFRKGKAPKKIIENMYGKDMFVEDALNEILPEAYDEAVRELGLKVIAQPDVQVDELESGKDVVAAISVEVRPEAKLGKYMGVEIPRQKIEVTEDVLDMELDKQRHMNARRVNVDDRAIEKGDKVTIDFAGTVDGVAFEGGTAEDQELEIGSNTFIPGFEEQLVGHSVGEEFDIDVTFPEDYFNEELAGKDAVFHIKVHGIQVEELPELDDEFIKDISEFDTIQEYKADLREKKEQEAKDAAERNKSGLVLDKIAEGLEVELPEAMVSYIMDQQIQNMDQNMRSQGIGLEDYLSMLGQDMADFRENLRPEAEKEALRSLALDAIIEAENIEVTDEDVRQDAEEAAKRYFPDDDEKAKDMADTMVEQSGEYLKEQLLSRKAMDLVVEAAVEVEPVEEEAEVSESEEMDKNTEDDKTDKE
ncbi:MAG: trigger factor [Tissierellia bacterium]|nr:trigger factor [Tissierellia bacterium]